MSQSKTKSRNWQRILLVVSLGLNLIIIGAIAGAVIRGGPSNASARFDLTAGPLTRAMDSDHREVVRDALRDSGVFRPQDRSAMRADMEALLATLRAEVFDLDQFQEVLSRQRSRLQDGQQTVLTVVSRQIEDMTSDERAAFADRLEDQVGRGPPQRRDRN